MVEAVNMHGDDDGDDGCAYRCAMPVMIVVIHTLGKQPPHVNIKPIKTAIRADRRRTRPCLLRVGYPAACSPSRPPLPGSCTEHARQAPDCVCVCTGSRVEADLGFDKATCFVGKQWKCCLFLSWRKDV